MGTGSGEDSEGGGLIPTAQGSTITVVDGNYLPLVNAHQIGPLSENITYNSTGFGTLVGLNVSVYHSAIDRRPKVSHGLKFLLNIPIKKPTTTHT